MECREFNSMILPHLDGLLRQDQSALLESHAAGCAACARELALQSRLSGAMGEMGREEIIAPPEMGSLVISKLKSERRGYFNWVPAAWRKTVAAAAAILLLAGGSAGVTAGLQIARDGKMVALDPPGAAIGDNSLTAPAGGGETGLIVEGMPGDSQGHGGSINGQQQGDPAVMQTGGEGAEKAGEGPAPGGIALLSSNTVIASTILNVNVPDLDGARIKAVALAAGTGAATRVFPEESGDQKIVVLRMTVASDQAPGLIEKLSGLGLLADRQDESRNITALYNETQVLCSELESKRGTAGNAGELQAIDQQISSYRQQLNTWEAEAGKRVIMLWLENK